MISSSWIRGRPLAPLNERADAAELALECEHRSLQHCRLVSRRLEDGL